MVNTNNYYYSYIRVLLNALVNILFIASDRDQYNNYSKHVMCYYYYYYYDDETSESRQNLL